MGCLNGSYNLEKEKKKKKRRKKRRKRRTHKGQHASMLKTFNNLLINSPP